MSQKGRKYRARAPPIKYMQMRRSFGKELKVFNRFCIVFVSITLGLVA
jgi:hypothetical protein